MWYPASIVTPAEAEPVSLEEARSQCGILSSELYFDVKLTRLIKAARADVEEYCGVRFATQTIAVKCDGFADMERLPEAPVQSVTSISYVDTAGATQTLAASVYELRADGLEAAIVLKFGQRWPAIQSGSRITLTLVAGYADLPPTVRQAMLLFVGDAFAAAEPMAAGGWSTFDSLLCNHRRGA